VLPFLTHKLNVASVTKIIMFHLIFQHILVMDFLSLPRLYSVAN